MHITKTNFEGLLIITPEVHEDTRGYFMESYNHKLWSDALHTSFVQDNESMSNKGVLRGLHFQKPPFAQDKLVRVIRGSVMDVVVDLRKNAKTYGEHFKIHLSAENKKQLFIPKGFAHGFLCLEDQSIFSYKCSAYYNKTSEDAIYWNDKDLQIDWQIENPIVSGKDKIAKAFSGFNSPF